MQKKIKTVFRIASTLLLALGVAFIVLYLAGQKSTLSSQLLAEPSYYSRRSGNALLISGICVLALGALSSFLSWLKIMDIDEDVMPNAGYSAMSDIRTWLGGSSLDAKKTGKAPGTEGKRSERSAHKTPGDTRRRTDDKTVVKENETAVEEADTLCDEGTVVCDEGTVVCDEGTVVCDEGTVVCDEGTVVCDEGTVVCDEGTVVCDEGTVVCDEGTVICGDDGTVISERARR